MFGGSLQSIAKCVNAPIKPFKLPPPKNSESVPGARSKPIKRRDFEHSVDDFTFEGLLFFFIVLITSQGLRINLIVCTLIFF